MVLEIYLNFGELIVKHICEGGRAVKLQIKDISPLDAGINYDY